MNPFRQGYKKIAILTGLALVLVTIGTEYFQFKKNQELILADLKNRLHEHTSNVNLRARHIQGYVQGLKQTAENNLYFIQKFNVTSPLFSFLTNDPNGQGYYLNIPQKDASDKMIGTVLGQGSTASFSQSLKDELNMALMLNTNLEIALNNNRGAVWAYYNSKNHFQIIQPWITSENNLYNSLSEQKFFFKKATPERNPHRVNFWTPIYQDGAGFKDSFQKGFIVTNASPVYNGNEFLGCVGLDLSLSELNRVMKRFFDLQGSLLLINKEHQILALNGPEETDFTPTSIERLEEYLSPETIQLINQEIRNPTEDFHSLHSDIIYVRPLLQAPWYMVYIGNKVDLFWNALMGMLQDIIVITSILLFVVGMAYMLVIRDFISPAQKLIDHISKENRGLQSHPQGLPARWEPWFKIVTHIFKENRALMKELENRVALRTKQLEQKNKKLEQTLKDLKNAQNQIIVQEKLASLGSLTAGIAHEIKNPLNFIINFSDLSLEYVEELKEKVSEKSDLFPLIEENIQKARAYAEKADSIVKSMLAHARGSSGKVTTFNLNILLDESVDLAYLGFQGKETNFSTQIVRKYDSKIGNIQGFQQDLARVFLNIVNNACYAMHIKKQEQGDSYAPELLVQTKNTNKGIAIIIQDNGIGMPSSLLKKVFTPFFTTKDAGKGTGLGLSLSYDIITQQHHGHLSVQSKEGKDTCFVIEIPKNVSLS